MTRLSPGELSRIILLGGILHIVVMVQTGCAQGVVVAESASYGKTLLSKRESLRAERFIQHVFPTRALRKYMHTREQPAVRNAKYSVVEQDGLRFLVVGFTAWWKEPINMLAIYRWEKSGPKNAGGPNQVWLSNAWHASYYGMNFQTAESGGRAIVLMTEGGGETSQFELASIFTFQNHPNGVAVRDLTPSLPQLRAHTNFPLRALYGQEVKLEHDGKSVMLSASDEEYRVNMVTSIRPTTSWRYRGGRFEKITKGVGTSAWTLEGGK